MEIKIEIEEEKIKNILEKEIARQIMEERNYENREAKIGVRTGIEKAVKQYVYAKKDEIIDRVVERSSVEVAKKAIPKLLERLSEK